MPDTCPGFVKVPAMCEKTCPAYKSRELGEACLRFVLSLRAKRLRAMQEILSRMPDERATEGQPENRQAADEAASGRDNRTGERG